MEASASFYPGGTGEIKVINERDFGNEHIASLQRNSALLEEVGEEEFLQQQTGKFFPLNIVIITDRHVFLLSGRWELTQEFI